MTTRRPSSNPVAKPDPVSKAATRDVADELTEGSGTGYRDRPTDDGMKGDGADEPNAGSAHLPKQGPSRVAHQPEKKPPAR